MGWGYPRSCKSRKWWIFVPPGNHTALAEAIAQLAKNRSEAYRMGIAARKIRGSIF